MISHHWLRSCHSLATFPAHTYTRNCSILCPCPESSFLFLISLRDFHRLINSCFFLMLFFFFLLLYCTHSVLSFIFVLWDKGVNSGRILKHLGHLLKGSSLTACWSLNGVFLITLSQYKINPGFPSHIFKLIINLENDQKISKNRDCGSFFQGQWNLTIYSMDFELKELN